MAYPLSCPRVYSNPAGNILASGFYRSYITQDIANEFPNWMHLRQNPRSYGQQLISAAAINLEKLDRALEYNIKSKFLNTAPLDEVDVLYRVKLPSNIDLTNASASGIRCVTAPANASPSGAQQIWVSEVTNLEDFYYNLIPTRMEIAASGVFTNSIDGVPWNAKPSGILDQESYKYDIWKNKHRLTWTYSGGGFRKQDFETMEDYETYPVDTTYGSPLDLDYSKGVLWWLGSNTDNLSIDPYTKLLLHGDDLTDSSPTPKTVSVVGNVISSTVQKKFGTGSICFQTGNDAYTKLLLHGDSTPLVDSEPTPKTLSIQGAGVTYSTLQKVFGTGSIRFSGSPSYMYFADSADWYFVDGAFSIDGWWNFDSFGLNHCLVSQTDSGQVNGWNLIEGGNVLEFNVWQTSSYLLRFRCSFTPTPGTWYHLSVVRIDNADASTSWRMFINGISQTLTKTLGNWNATVPDAAGILALGTDAYAGDPKWFIGYGDEIRISKGIARWSSNFTVPDQPWGVPGNLSIADSDDWSFGKGDFTIDFWVNFTSSIVSIDNTNLIGQRYDNNSMWYAYYTWSTNRLHLVAIYNGVAIADYYGYFGGATPTLGTWYHLAFERRGSTALIFVNGQSVALTETTAFGTQDMGNINGTLTVGKVNSVGQYLNGYMDELRISKGIARWSSNFSVPSSPYHTDNYYINLTSTKTQEPIATILDPLASYDLTGNLDNVKPSGIIVDASGYINLCTTNKDRIFQVVPRYDYYILDKTNRYIYFREDYSNPGVFISNA
jgi:hypothetical protein